ncbi:hypothetical protein D9756_009116 [Leucocoprinus leucothites]|uniref:Protein kinase domain-containing protein n=1 Tax=Leucocoprinus leucothites TaxID=201217 RepID=A0A8H5FV23_9AGAR|nr:hypothetical protein D9756_009116 [Leucoagaricus leucothites]
MAERWIADNLQSLSYEDLTHLVREVPRDPAYSGGYADVYTGKYLKDAKTEVDVAIKVLRLGSEQEENKKVTKRLIRERTVWLDLNHKNILPFIGLIEGLGRRGCPALMSPWCSNGTITDYLLAHPEADKSQLLLGVINGLEYLHKKDVVHGDLKPANILISDEGVALLCDFGRSLLTTHRGFTTRPSGTARYQAPELFNEGVKHTKSSDIYGLGMTCSEIWTGLKPYSLFQNDASIILHVTKTKARPPRPDTICAKTNGLWDVFDQCWATIPEERLETSQAADSLRRVLLLNQEVLPVNQN